MELNNSNMQEQNLQGKIFCDYFIPKLKLSYQSLGFLSEGINLVHYYNKFPSS